MIASSPDVAYIHEPFNIEPETRVCAARFDTWFTYICEENEGEYYRQLRDTIDFRYDIKRLFQMPRGLVDAGGRLAGAGRSIRNRIVHVRPLLKDPIAVLSAEWLASRFGTANVVMIRHPAAFAGSLKVKAWTHPFEHFTRQPILMKRHLQPFAAELGKFAAEEQDIIDQAGLLWNVIHSRILEYRKAHPDWIYVRHEDLSRDPLSGFLTIFEKLGLEFTQRKAAAIRAHSRGQTPESEEGKVFHELRRDSVANIKTWKNRLTEAEIDRLKGQVREISREFYSEADW